MTNQELKEKTLTLRRWFSRRGEKIESLDDIQMGHTYRYKNEETGKTFVFTSRSGWDRHNRQFGASFMRIQYVDGTFGDLCDLAMGDEVVVTRMAPPEIEDIAEIYYYDE
jgi:hypothetical protein